MYVFGVPAREGVSNTVGWNPSWRIVQAGGLMLWLYMRPAGQCKWEKSYFWWENSDLKAQYDQEVASLCYEHDRLQVTLVTFNSGSEASYEPFHVVHERLEAYRSASVSFHVPLEPHLLPNSVNIYWGRRIIYETLGVDRTRVVELVSSALDAMESESCATTKVLSSAQLSDTVLDADTDPRACSPDPS